MKKPLILIVDDDPAVLEALEAFLVPAYRNLCQIEAFDRPAAVLEQTTCWKEEQRSVAVAIVDQKMPELSGTDLIQRLRSFSPAAHMQAILLTGYGGLESAIEAKNHAKIDRYLEKPWRKEHLDATVTEKLRRFLVVSGMEGYYVLAEASDPARLLEVFRLRYRIYRQSSYFNAYLTPNANEVDLDGHDRFSIILCLLRRDLDGEQVVGTLRMTTRTPSPMLGALKTAVASLEDAGALLDLPRPHPFPLGKIFPQEVVDEFIESLEAGGAKLAEVGRHALTPEHRKYGQDTRQIEGTVAFFPEFNLTHCLAAIPLLHKRHYTRLGFARMEGVPITKLRSPSGKRLESVMAIWSSLDRVHSPAQERTETLTTRREGSPEAGLCFCPTYPGCLPLGYLSRKFGDTDLFCPSEAEKYLASSSDDSDTCHGPASIP